MTVCNVHGCPDIATAHGRCPTHQPTPWAGSTRRRRLPPAWDDLRALILKRDHHRCYRCGAPAHDVDHIHGGDNHHPSNLAAICRPCHAAKTAQEAAAGRREKRRPT